jgi:hypothetical protein
VTSLFILPMQWPRYLDKVRFTLVAFQVELLRVGKRDWGWPVPHLDDFTHLNAETLRDGLGENTNHAQLRYKRLRLRRKGVLSYEAGPRLHLER